MKTPKWVNEERLWCPQCRQDFPLDAPRCPQCSGELVRKTVRVELKER